MNRSLALSSNLKADTLSRRGRCDEIGLTHVDSDLQIIFLPSSCTFQEIFIIELVAGHVSLVLNYWFKKKISRYPQVTRVT